jgi:hypothetical protein
MSSSKEKKEVKPVETKKTTEKKYIQENIIINKLHDLKKQK